MNARKIIMTCTHTERNQIGVLICGFEYKQGSDRSVTPDLFSNGGMIIQFQIMASDAEMIEMLGKDFEITLSPVGS